MNEKPPSTLNQFIEVPPKPALFSISNVAMMIGVSKYVIASWEKKNLCSPAMRTSFGARRYSHAQIQLLKELAAKHRLRVRERFTNSKTKKEKGCPVWIERHVYDALKEHLTLTTSNESITSLINNIIRKYLGQDKVTFHVTLDRASFEGLSLEDDLEDLLNRLGKTIKVKKSIEARQVEKTGV